MEEREVVVRLRPSKRSVRVAPGTTLLEAVRRAGLPIASGCGAEGLCARCGVAVLGDAAHVSPERPDETRAKRRNRVEQHLRLACRARVWGEVAVTAPYW